MIKTFLRRWLAVWSDGESRIIHANLHAQALDLARALVAPKGAHVVRVEELR